MPSIRDTIARVAAQEGIDPAYALAVAERESGFDPNAHASKSIAGLYQMTGNLRARYGAGADPESQTRAFAAFTRDLQGDMRARLGRDPSNGETYLGHFWGAGRASRVLNGTHAGLSPQDLFSPYELSLNPSLARRGQSGASLARNIMADIDRRGAKYGGNGGGSEVSAGLNSGPNQADFAQYGQPADDTNETSKSYAGFGAIPAPGRQGSGRVRVAANEPFDFSQYGQPEHRGDVPEAKAGDVDLKVNSRPGTELDLSQFGIPDGGQPIMVPPAQSPVTPSRVTQPIDFSSFGTPASNPTDPAQSAV